MYRLCIVCVSRVFEPKLRERIWRSWEQSKKTISSRTGKMRRTGSASSNSCPPIIQRLGSLRPTSSGTLVGYANLTNTRSLALLGEPDAGAYELLFSFSSPEEKNKFLNLVRSNEDMGNEYIIELTPPTTEEIGNARPLATILPHDVLNHVMLIAVTLKSRSLRESPNISQGERPERGWK